MTRVHASDGALLGEYSKERRLYLPIQAMPKLVTNAFLAAEDKNFYEHGGIDFTGMARAAVVYAQNFGSNRRPQGASTITQQVAKNFLLTNEVSFARKIKEALLAMRIERAYSKDRILELYLNEIYLGLGAYGIAAASLVYFDKSVNELTVAEAAYLAALPKAPGTLHPVRNRDRSTERRNYVIDRLLENGWIKQADADKARKEPLVVASRSNAAHTFAGEYFAEEVRRDIFERYGEKKLYEGGLSVRTTLDPKLQVMARKTVAAGLVNFRRGPGLARRHEQARHIRRLGRQARRDQVARRHLALADGRGAGDIRPVGRDRFPARPRTGRRDLQGPANRPHHAGRCPMGEAGRRCGARQTGDGFGLANSVAG
jgi:penicillin-binding protein 1A